MKFTVGDYVRSSVGGQYAGQCGRIVAISGRGMIEVEFDRPDLGRQEYAAGALTMISPADRPAPPITITNKPSADVAALADDSGSVADALTGHPPTPIPAGHTENPGPPPVDQQPDPPPAPPPVIG